MNTNLESLQGMIFLPLSILAFAFVLNGFPNIQIGKKVIKNYYNQEDEKDEE